MNNTFNYRIVQHEDCVSIHEIHYSDGEIKSYVKRPVLTGNDLRDLRGEFTNLERAFLNSSIDKKDLPK